MFQATATIFIRVHDETPPVAAMCISNEDCSSIGINR
jgi:hypothetical protein